MTNNDEVPILAIDPTSELPAPEPTKQTPHQLAQSNETRRGRHNEWALIGIQNGAPVWKYDWTMRELNQKYPPAKLCALRAERGVGSSKVRNKHLTNQA